MSAVCLIVLLIVGAFLFDAIRGDSLAQSFPVLLGYATPAVITLLTAAKLGGAVDEVKTQVNGNYDKISSRNRELADQNRELPCQGSPPVARDGSKIWLLSARTRSDSRIASACGKPALAFTKATSKSFEAVVRCDSLMFRFPL